MTVSKIFEIKTVKSSVIRTLFEVLKEVLKDINILVYPTCIKITEMDSKKKSLIHLVLESKNFEYYNYNSTNECIKISVNTQNLFKVIKNLKNTDSVTLFMNDTDAFKLGVVMENQSTNRKSFFHVLLADIPIIHRSIPEYEYDSEFSLPSAEFNNYCKTMNQLLIKDIEIIGINQQIIFKGVGPISDISIELGNNKVKEVEEVEDGTDEGSEEEVEDGTVEDGTVEVSEEDEDEEEVIQGKFSIEYLLLFSKAQNLSRNVSFFLSNKYEWLMLKYHVGTLGTLIYAVQQI